MKRSLIILSVILSGFLLSCGKASNNPRSCVSQFIISIEQHDMSKAWGLLGKDAQAYYNTLGERQRRSGKGAFENEIDKIKTFRNARSDYSIHADKGVQDTIKLIVFGGKEFNINITDEDGEYKIKDQQSVRNVLDVIAGELKQNERFY
jgi:hypothetical protein